MPAFLLIDLIAIAVSLGALALVRAHARRLYAGEKFLPGLSTHVDTFFALAVLTIVFDTVMVAAGLTHYSPDAITGFRIWWAPIEDLAYPLIATIVLPSLVALIVRLRRDTVAATDTRSQADAPLARDQIAQPNRSVAKVAHPLRQIVRSSRPYSWINTAYPFGFAYLLAGGRPTDAAFIVGVVLFLGPYNLLMYGINDVYDYESDRRNPRKTGIEGVVLDPRLHRPIILASIGLILPFTIAFAWLSTTWATVALFGCLTTVLAYSVPILRAKERPLVDSITSSSHFVGPAIVGIAAINPTRLGDATTLAILGAFALWGVASHLLGAVQDTVADREAGIRSTATVWGARVAARIATGAYLVAGALLLFAGRPGQLFAVLAVPYVLISVPYLNVRDEAADSAHRAWRAFLWLNPVAGAIVTIGTLALAVTGGLS